MKKILIIALCSLALTACLAQKEEPAEVVITNADQALDNMIYEDAIETMDVNRCEEVAEESSKNECIEVIVTFEKMEKALVNMDKTLCKDVAFDRYKKECESAVDKAIKEKEIKDKIEQVREEDKSKNKLAVESNDPKLCDEIQEEYSKDTCRYNILVNQAVQQEDATICEQIGRADLVKLCEDKF